MALVVSDDHKGLKAAIAAVLRGATWQRCRTHFGRNLLTRVPRTSQGMVATLVRTIFEQPDHDSVWAQHTRVVDQLTGRFDDAATMLADAADDPLAFSTFPPEHWSAIRSNQPDRRVNKEIRRRTDVVGIFPTAPPSYAWSVPYWLNKTMSGQWPSVTWARRAWPKRGSARSRGNWRR